MSEERNYTLYRITAPDSDKFYIGITGVTVEKRLEYHLNAARYSKRKYKFLNWLRKRMTTATITPMIVSLTKEVAVELERLTIDLCFKHESDFTLNTAPGGLMPPSRRGCVVTDSHREKISKAHKGRKQTAEHISKVAAANTGKKRTPEFCSRISAKMKGRKPHPSSIAASVAKFSKTVIGVNEAGDTAEFKSASDASRWLGQHPNAVCVSIRVGCRCGGYRWSYKK